MKRIFGFYGVIYIYIVTAISAVVGTILVGLLQTH